MKYLLIYLAIGLIYALIVWRLEWKIRDKRDLGKFFKLIWFLELITFWPIEALYEIQKRLNQM